jgi:hypothetical protein
MELNKACIIHSGSKKDCPVCESGRTYRMLNDSGYEFTVYKVDSCLIKDNKEKKCDFLFVVDKKKERIACFVELKGTGLADAISQIHNSINILYKSLNEHKIFARIVGKRVTPNIKSRRARLDERLKHFGGDLKIVSAHELKETI